VAVIVKPTLMTTASAKTGVAPLTMLMAREKVRGPATIVLFFRIVIAGQTVVGVTVIVRFKLGYLDNPGMVPNQKRSSVLKVRGAPAGTSSGVIVMSKRLLLERAHSVEDRVHSVAATLAVATGRVGKSGSATVFSTGGAI